MKFGVVTFPGSNCDGDITYILKDILQQEVVSLWHKNTDLEGVDMVILPGGFSYGDYLRSGAIARFSPIMKEIIQHAKKGGGVFGICNGFQVLTESGLLEGALLHNNTQRFNCKNSYLKPGNSTGFITKDLDRKKTYTIPLAHGEGRFYAAENTLKQLQDNDQILFRYANHEGIVDETANPNGSMDNIAGIQNKKGNVFAMMPHPERSADPLCGNIDGQHLLRSIINNWN